MQDWGLKRMNRVKTWAHGRPSQARERGATLVEAAIVFPILILIVMAILEIGMVFKDYLSVSAFSREGARIAALAGRDDAADCAVLVGVASLATQRDLERISSIQIYKASEGTGTQGATNTWTYNGGDASECHVPAEIGDGWDPGAIAYPPGSRKTTVGPVPLDLIGVRVMLTRSWITQFPPFNGPPFTIDESTITRLEPEAFFQP